MSSTSAADELEDTAYRQYGKPSRLNLGFSGQFVFLEGIASRYWSFIPEMQFLLSFNGRFSTDLYLETIGNFSSILSSELSSSDQDEILEDAPEG